MEKNFKCEIQQTARYKRIISVLKDKLMPSYLSFVVFAAQDFEAFIFKLRRREPMVHVLYSCMGTLLTSLLQKFVYDKCITKEEEGTTNLKQLPIHELAKLNVRDQNNRKRITSMEIGAKTRCLIVENRVQTIDEPEFLLADEEKEASDCYRVHAEFGLEHQPAASQRPTSRIDWYWEDIASMKDELGNALFPHLTTLVNCLLTLIHENATTESGFSLNKAIVVAHGTSLDEKTLVAIRVVKNAIINAGGYLNIPITNPLQFVTAIRNIRLTYCKLDGSFEKNVRSEGRKRRKKLSRIDTIQEIVTALKK